MALTLIPFEQPTLKLADTLVGLTTGLAFECQLTTAELLATQNMVQVEQTPCNPPSQIPGRPTWGLHAVWFQDWTDPAGLSAYTKANQGKRKFYELTADKDDVTTKATGECWISTGNFGGVVGPAPLKSGDVTWGCVDEPDIVPVYTPVIAAAATETDVTEAEVLEAVPANA